MSAQPQPGSLSRAQTTIEGMLRELNSTVESVEELSKRDPHAALRLVEDQRAALERFVDSIARDVAAPVPMRQRLRRSAGAVAVAATLVVSSIAVAAVVAVSRTPAEAGASDIDAVRARISAARATPVLSERLAHLNAASRIASGLPDDVSGDNRELTDDLATMLDQTQDEIERGQEGTVLDHTADLTANDAGNGTDTSPQRDPNDPITSITDITEPDVDDTTVNAPAPK